MPENRRGEWRQALQALAETQRPDSGVDYGVHYTGPESIDPTYLGADGASLRAAPDRSWRDHVRDGWRGVLEATGALPTDQRLTHDQQRLVDGLVGPEGRNTGLINDIAAFALPQSAIARAIAVGGAPHVADAIDGARRQNWRDAFIGTAAAATAGLLNRVGAKDAKRMRQAGNERALKDHEWQSDMGLYETVRTAPGKGYSLRDPGVLPSGKVSAGGAQRKIVDSDGKAIGEIHYTARLKGDGTSHIDVKNVGSSDGSNSIGPSAVRAIARQLKREHSGSSIGGYRVTGARNGPAASRGPLDRLKHLDANTVLRGTAPAAGIGLEDWLAAVQERERRNKR